MIRIVQVGLHPVWVLPTKQRTFSETLAWFVREVDEVPRSCCALNGIQGPSPEYDPILKDGDVIAIWPVMRVTPAAPRFLRFLHRLHFRYVAFLRFFRRLFKGSYY